MRREASSTSQVRQKTDHDPAFVWTLPYKFTSKQKNNSSDGDTYGEMGQVYDHSLEAFPKPQADVGATQSFNVSWQERPSIAITDEVSASVDVDTSYFKGGVG